MSPRHVDTLMTTRGRAATTGVEVDLQLAREPPVISRRISSPRMRKKIASRPSEHHSGAAREMLAVRATRTKRRMAHMRSAMESLIHSLESNQPSTRRVIKGANLYSADPTANDRRTL